MSQFDLIIFDCDGVLVDSERLANQVFASILFEEHKLEFSLEDMFTHFVGRSKSQCMSIVEGMIGTKPSESLANRYENEINSALETSVEAVAGARELLAGLSVPYCVASSGSHEKMRTTLGRTGLLNFVEGKIFSTSDVNRGKPFPDVYLSACKKMGVEDPARCLVVEDSPTGVEGARNAGMTVFGYSELMDEDRLHNAGANLTFQSLNDLPRLMQSYVATA